MKMFQRGLMALVLATTAVGAISAHAEVVNIPWSAAIQATPNPEDCAIYFPLGFGTGSNECYVDFPLSIPVGHTIEQIAVLHSTDNMFPNGQPFIEAFLSVATLAPAWNDAGKFAWSSSNAVPTGTIDRHTLMAQFGKVYVDQFVVAPSTNYTVHVSLQYGAAVSGIEVTYN